MIVFYRLEHHHTKSGYESNLHIGTFSSYTLAESAIDQLMNKPGFDLYPRSNFVITKLRLGSVHWIDGFIKTNEGDIEI